MNLLIRFDEIMLKGNNQQLFFRQFMHNMRELFLGCTVERVSGGVWVEKLAPEAIKDMVNVPGVAIISKAVRVATDIESIQHGIDELLTSLHSRSFRISASRSYKQYQFTSKQLAEQLGKYVLETYGWKVDLSNYETEIEIAIEKNNAFIWCERLEGVGGLPTGTSGKIAVLLSGGIDSPVAAHALMSRGAEVLLVHFQNETHVTEEVSQKIIDLAQALACYQPGVELCIVPFALYQREIIKKIPADYRMLITRRCMFRIAQKIARTYGAEALATGDSLGQVASQTLPNLSAVYAATSMLTLTPLIGLSKKLITDRARAIGTLAISNRPYEDCCSLFVAKHPVTNAATSKVDELEQRLGILIDDEELGTYYTVVCKHQNIKTREH